MLLLVGFVVGGLIAWRTAPPMGLAAGGTAAFMALAGGVAGVVLALVLVAALSLARLRQVVRIALVLAALTAVGLGIRIAQVWHTPSTATPARPPLSTTP
jgi:hypothetical protein